jgi:phosphopantothenoylcysteine decarboxylase / phosphopantothenate---cysteine ligase
MSPGENGLPAGRGGLHGRRVVLGVTGGIAAYKAAELCRLLTKAGAEVRVILTEAATQFITPLTMQTLSGHPVGRELFDLTEESQIGHIRLADEADLIIVAPATADAIARLAAGMANDLLAAVVLASRAPVLLAPAMNVNMWQNPITQSNLARLLGGQGSSDAGGRFATVGPDRGPLACGWVGQGRLIEPAEILLAAEQQVVKPAGGASRARDLAGRQVIVTAGPTREPIDDVRFLGNRSSGKMGFAIAEAAAARGARVTLIAGPVGLPTPNDVASRIDVETAEQMGRALAGASAADVVVMTAAVADFRPSAPVAGKLSRRALADGQPLTLALAPNPDLLAELGRNRRGPRPLLVGFAAEAGGGAGLIARAREKLAEKRCDLVVANDIGAAGIGFGADENEVTLVFADGRLVPLPRASKLAIAHEIWDHLVRALAEGRSEDPAAAAPTVNLPVGT